MRIGAIILALNLLLVGSATWAGNGEMAFRKKIKNSIHYPANVSNKVETTVYVEFTVNENYEIQIETIDCEEEEIRLDISRQLMGMRIDKNNLDIVNKTFYFQFHLQVEP